MSFKIGDKVKIIIDNLAEAFFLEDDPEYIEGEFIGKTGVVVANHPEFTFQHEVELDLESAGPHGGLRFLFRGDELELI